jgi:glycosyltransferase involved in cell wall biosynthesis
MTTLFAAPVAHLPATTAPGRLRRVLYVLNLDPSRKFGSMEEQAFLLAKAFRERGGLFLPLFAAAPDEGTRRRYAAAGLSVAFLDVSRFGPWRLLRLLGLMVRHRVEVVHWNFFPPLRNRYVWALSLLAPWARHYLTDHNSREEEPQAPGAVQSGLRRFFLSRYRRVLGVSRFVVECLARQGGWPQATPLLHFINTDRFAPCHQTRVAFRAEAGADGDAERPFILVTVAQLIEAKGIDVAIRALVELPPRVSLWVAGEGPASADLRRLAAELGVEARVKFWGVRAEVQPFYQAADACVCPSRWAEAAGLVNLEAQACGLPVLASAVGGIPEYVADGQTGLLFPPGDHKALAACVRRLLDDPGLAAEMGRRARERAEAEFSPAARLDEYLDLYR